MFRCKETCSGKAGTWTMVWISITRSLGKVFHTSKLYANPKDIFTGNQAKKDKNTSWNTNSLRHEFYFSLILNIQPPNSFVSIAWGVNTSVFSRQGKSVLQKCRSDHITFLFHTLPCITNALRINLGSSGEWTEPFSVTTHLHSSAFIWSHAVPWIPEKACSLMILWPSRCYSLYMESLSHLVYLTAPFLTKIQRTPCNAIRFHPWLSSPAICGPFPHSTTPYKYHNDLVIFHGLFWYIVVYGLNWKQEDSVIFHFLSTVLESL